MESRSIDSTGQPTGSLKLPIRAHDVTALKGIEGYAFITSRLPAVREQSEAYWKEKASVFFLSFMSYNSVTSLSCAWVDLSIYEP